MEKELERGQAPLKGHARAPLPSVSKRPPAVVRTPRAKVPQMRTLSTTLTTP